MTMNIPDGGKFLRVGGGLRKLSLRGIKSRPPRSSSGTDIAGTDMKHERRNVMRQIFAASAVALFATVTFTAAASPAYATPIQPQLPLLAHSHIVLVDDGDDDDDDDRRFNRHYRYENDGWRGFRGSSRDNDDDDDDDDDD
ncbi:MULTISPECIES: hypothetical protein [Rhizobium/Agrobacterium group]|uniref:hypothetical protein n=1 Tax=Rhizobium/Agrobacterium group TaxID=227290 RepID=UPI0023014296|nr:MULTISPECIES: hypothetical protein [Rhizobium/Agrobacterium group]MDA5635030.1 hypothetical protein [Agrobacterium sp. ST15.16.024]MDF1890178.1 hypothetical protein [Rhizobium rhizogenes]